GLPHPDFGEGVVAFVVGDGAWPEADLDDGLDDRLARFKQPKNYVFVDELPRNAMGKVQKAQLRSDHSETFNLIDL
ncbi:MAG: malonyl-CoA synthase, partial [Actinomycetia bacterium]|nr:malonyl-CoA synthase [Actinomycetes bacterium]